MLLTVGGVSVLFSPVQMRPQLACKSERLSPPFLDLIQKFLCVGRGSHKITAPD